MAYPVIPDVPGAASTGDVTLLSGAVATGAGTSLSVRGLATAIMTVTGTFIATVTFQGTEDGVNWNSIKATQLGTDAEGVTATAVGEYELSCAGLAFVRPNMTAYVSGSVTVTGQATGAVAPERVVDARTVDPVTGNAANVSAAHLTKNQVITGFAVSVAGFGALTNAVGTSDPQVEASFDNQPHAGMPTDAPYFQSVVPGITISGSVTGSTTAQNVTLAPGISGTLTRGAPWKIQTGSFLSIAGANPEIVYVNSTAGSQVNGIFLKNHSNADPVTAITFNGAKDASVPNPTGAGTGYSATQLFNKVTNQWEDELSIAGENSGATGGGGALAAEVECTSGGPPLANGTPSLLQYDREVAALGKVGSGATVSAGYAITSTTAGNTSLTPTTPSQFATITIGSWIRLTGSGTAEYVRVADTYIISATPATIPLTNPVVNTGQTTAVWDIFGPNGPGQNPVLWTGEGFEGVLVNDRTQPGFGRVLQGNPAGEAAMTVGGLQTTQVTPTSLTVIKATPGRLARILVTTVNGANAINIYDNASAASGTIIGYVAASAAAGTIIDLQMPAANGITIAATASAGQITVSWS